jgi:ferritin
MIASQKIVAAINEQMGNEFGAMLQYYAIAAHFGAEGLPELSTHFKSRPRRKRSTRSVLSDSSSTPVPA